MRSYGEAGTQRSQRPEPLERDGFSVSLLLPLAVLRVRNHLLLLMPLRKVPARDRRNPLAAHRSELGHSLVLLPLRLQPEHPLRHLAAGLPHNTNNCAQLLKVVDGEEGDRLTGATSTTSTTDPVDVG